MRKGQGGTADYLVASCANCGMINIMPRGRTDGQQCENCGGGPLIPLGFGILHKEPCSSLQVQIEADTRGIDRAMAKVKELQVELENTSRMMQEIGEKL